MQRVNPRMRDIEAVQRCGFPNCQAACCVYGAWVDQHQASEILRNARLLIPHLPPEHADPALWFDDRRAADRHALSGEVVHTSVVESPDHYGGTACIFMRPDFQCALQSAAQAAGLHPWRYKPFYCILHPLDLDEEGRITLDAAAEMVDEPASCLRRASQGAPLVLIFEEELRYLLGEKGYARLKASP